MLQLARRWPRSSGKKTRINRKQAAIAVSVCFLHHHTPHICFFARAFLPCFFWSGGIRSQRSAVPRLFHGTRKPLKTLVPSNVESPLVKQKPWQTEISPNNTTSSSFSPTKHFQSWSWNLFHFFKLLNTQILCH